MENEINWPHQLECKYEQLKVAVQDLLIEIGISSSDLKSLAARADYSDDHIGPKVTMKVAQKLIDAGILNDVKSYLIKVNPPNAVAAFFIDNVVLTGEKYELIKKMQTGSFVAGLGIDESLYFEKFELVEEDSLDFPEE